jgi:L-asparaginase II
VQEACRALVAEAAEVDAAGIPTAVDGCGVVTFALPLERMALAFANLPSLEGGDRVTEAMRAHPDHIRGPRAADSIVLRHAASLAGRPRLPGGAAAGCATLVPRRRADRLGPVGKG